MQDRVANEAKSDADEHRLELSFIKLYNSSETLISVKLETKMCYPISSSAITHASYILVYLISLTKAFLYAS